MTKRAREIPENLKYRLRLAGYYLPFLCALITLGILLALVMAGK